MAERLTIAELAEAVADGRDVDWAAVEAAATDDAERAAIDRLKRVHQLVGRLRSPGGNAAESGAGTVATAGNADDAHARWGHLTILEKVGEGAFGEVYRAHDPKLARDVALKLLRAPATSGPDTATAIEEGRLLARIRHPNVVTVYGADRIDGRVGLWMEFVGGRTLEQELQERAAFDSREVARIGVDLARALTAVHAAGLVHRDVKAQNVMREDDGRLVLMDFGTGREQAHAAAGAVGDLAGTPLYVAPEVLDGGPATVRSDIYSLGVLLYHLVTGGYPTTADTLGNLFAAHRTRARTSLATSRPDLPAAFVKVVDRAIMTDPAARYGTAREIETALSRVAATVPAWRSRHPWLVGSGVLSIVAAAVALVVLSPWAKPLPVPLPDAGGRFSLPAPQATPAPESRSSQAAPQAEPEPIGCAPSLPPNSRADDLWSLSNWILVADFENHTTVAGLDRLFSEDLQRELNTGALFRLVSQDRIEDALQLMRRPVNARLDLEAAREVSQRDGHIRAIITGRADTSAHGFSLSAHIVKPADGTAIANIPGAAADEGALPAAIRQAAIQIRSRLVEQLDSIPRDHSPLLPVTTSSVEALKFYALAITPSDASGTLPDPAVQEQYLHEAIARDSQFASAYLRLAVLIDAQHRPRSESELLMERARQLAETTTVAERDVIDGITHYWRARELTDDAQRAEAEMAATGFKAALLLEPYDSLALSSLHATDSMLGLPFETATIVAGSADTRPFNFSANVGAAVLRVGQGDLEGANHYWQRAANVEDPKGRGIEWFRLFPAERDWARGFPKDAAHEVDIALAGAQMMSPNVRANLMNAAVERLTTLGCTTRATAVAESIAEDQQVPRALTIALVLQRREAAEKLSNFLAPHSADRLGYLLRRFWIPAGRRDALATIMKMRGSQADPVLDIEMAFADNRLTDTVALGEAYLNQKWEPDKRPVLRVPITVARAHVALNERDAAVRLLEEYARRSPLIAAEDDQGYDWMRLRADLSTLYRATGLASEARSIEQDLLARLALADPDFPLLREIKRASR